VLKRIDEAALDSALAQARQERAERGGAAPAGERRPAHRRAG
jgi:hypothetical protein